MDSLIDLMLQSGVTSSIIRNSINNNVFNLKQMRETLNLLTNTDKELANTFHALCDELVRIDDLSRQARRWYRDAMCSVAFKDMVDITILTDQGLDLELIISLGERDYLTELGVGSTDLVRDINLRRHVMIAIVNEMDPFDFQDFPSLISIEISETTKIQAIQKLTNTSEKISNTYFNSFFKDPYLACFYCLSINVKI